MLHSGSSIPSDSFSFYLSIILLVRCTYSVSIVTILYICIEYTSLTSWTTRVSNPLCDPRFHSLASVFSCIVLSPLAVQWVLQHFIATLMPPYSIHLLYSSILYFCLVYRLRILYAHLRCSSLARVVWPLLLAPPLTRTIST
jgi:hypothetical protein